MSTATPRNNTLKPTSGIVAIIDIMGYQNFIDNNSASDAVGILQDVFANLKTAVVEDYAATWTTAQNPNKNRFDSIVIQTFSDTIVIHVPFDQDKPSKLRNYFTWFLFFTTVRIVQRRLFERGFPSRAGIDCGEYYFENGFLVGKPFMDAYRLCQGINLSAAALTQNAETTFMGLGRTFWEGYIGGMHYLTPLKSDDQKKMYLLCFLRAKEANTILTQDIRQFVYNSFWMHGKDIPFSVDDKVIQTEKFLRFWAMKRKKDA